MHVRYGSAYRKLRRELELSSALPDLARTLQLNALRRLISAAQQKSRFYRDRLVDTFGGPVDVGSFDLADLARLPLIGREGVGAGPRGFVVVGRREAVLLLAGG